MTIATDSATTAQLSARERGVQWLAELAFASGTLRFTTADVNVTSLDGLSWLGIGLLGSVGAVSESADTSASKLTLGFSVVNTALLAAALGTVEDYRGRRATLYMQLFDPGFQPVGMPVRRWAGYMDKVQVPRQRSAVDGGESSGRIELLCSRAGMARARNYQGLRLTMAQQQQRFPADTGLRYVTTLLEQPSTWLSKAFQEQ